MLIQIAGLVCLMLCVTPIMCFFIGTCWSFILFIDDIANELSSCLIENDLLNKRKNQQKDLKKNFCVIVQLYSDVKQLRASTKILNCKNIFDILTTSFIFYCLFIRFIAKFNICYEFLIFGFFAWALLSMSSSLLVSNSLLVSGSLRVSTLVE